MNREQKLIQLRKIALRAKSKSIHNSSDQVRKIGQIYDLHYEQTQQQSRFQNHKYRLK